MLKLKSGGFTASRYLYDDSVDCSDKSPVIDWYYKKREGNRTILHYVKFVGETVLYSTENEEWKQDFQTEKADTLIREMVWDLIEENENNFDYNGLTEEALSHIFFPEEDFYLDENGDPVFYLQPGDVYYDNVPEGVGLITFPLALEDILDEL